MAETIRFGGRQQGKSTVMQMLKEAALNEGRTVVTVTPYGVTRERRKKHLTIIESALSADSLTQP